VTDRLALKATPERDSAPAEGTVSGVAGVVAPALTLDSGPAMFGLRGFISPVGGLLTDLPALPASLRQLELLPVEAAEFYAVLLDRALALTPAEADGCEAFSRITFLIVLRPALPVRVPEYCPNGLG
jgi:hypothetical protein